MRNFQFKHIILFFILILPYFFNTLYAQNVGIGTDMPAEKLHIEGKVRVDSLAGTGTRVVGADAEGTMQQIAPGANGEVITQTATGPAYQKPINIHSTSLAADIEISSSTWTDVPNMTITFTATQTDALLMFTGSGFAYTDAIAYVEFRIMDGPTSLGGTNTNMQNYDNKKGSTTLWSCSRTRKITGLSIGTNYTYTLQGQVGGILGIENAAIYSLTNPDTHHLTLSVMQ